jgi:anti-sigma B factor antagonist
MDLQLDTRRDGDTVVVGVQGEIDNFSAPQLRAALAEAFERGARLTVVDLTATDFLDSSALGALVGVTKQQQGTDGKLVVVCPKPHLRKIFEIAHLDEVIGVYDDLATAIGSRPRAG